MLCKFPQGGIKNQPVLRVSIFCRRCSPLGCMYCKEVTAQGQASLRLRGGWHLAQGHLRFMRLGRLGCGSLGWLSWPHNEGLKVVGLPTLLMSDDATVKQ